MKKEIIEKIKSYSTVIVHRHVRPDPDAYGSQGGLCDMIQASFPDKQVYAVGEEEPSLAYLRTLDTISDDTYKDALVIVCDTANAERICDERYKLGKELIKIDHHPNEDPYGDLLWVDTSASSVSEMIYDLFKSGESEGLKLTDAGARLLFAGIVGDTGRFLYPSTTMRTMEYAGELLQYSFDRSELFNKMYETEEKVLKLQGYILQNFKLQPSGAAAVILKKELLEEFQVAPSEASLLVSTLGSVKGIKSWVFYIEENDQIRVRLRSKGPIINGLAKKYGGGGHPLAAGASVHSWEEVSQVSEELSDICRQS
ncbi:phosphoesterase RecJ-like protein [Bacillus ectoiniformans]|uniref:DHH family phosphoesterase n=1 Tax=Bacillus ectoiniformans TaxID=1494429 RepID=UPI0019573FB0|nr:bifunctional oligoribonuclease/PAP phosphatase NrnA [Bacillus ectoiniformans]MBM7648833.1 phosphoesterase RecJ-like protein [Bacillus ectoiniformans]